MELNKIYQEPCLETIKRFKPNSIDCVITSPPYWQLRDYGYPEQWGLEPTFNEYLEHLWQMMGGIYKALKPSGTVWVNLGDTYSTQSGTNVAIAKGKAKKQESTYLTNRGESGALIKDKSLPSKCLLLLPHRFAIGCMERGWIIRNDVVWAKRNGMPESVTDRFSKKHEYFFLMTKSTDYYFDLDGIRDPHSAVSLQRYNYGFTGQLGGESNNFKGSKFGKGRANTKYADGGRLNWSGEKSTEGNINGKNPGSISDFWDIPTSASSQAHYAQYNERLLYKPVIAGCPKGGVIYDPFIGTGTTGLIALKNGRNFIGSEMSEDYCKIANEHLDVALRQTNLF